MPAKENDLSLIFPLCLASHFVSAQNKPDARRLAVRQIRIC
jgi:hypothetical protein